MLQPATPLALPFMLSVHASCHGHGRGWQRLANKRELWLWSAPIRDSLPPISPPLLSPSRGTEDMLRCIMDVYIDQ